MSSRKITNSSVFLFCAFLFAPGFLFASTEIEIVTTNRGSISNYKPTGRTSGPALQSIKTAVAFEKRYDFNHDGTADAIEIDRPGLSILRSWPVKNRYQKLEIQKRIGPYREVAIFLYSNQLRDYLLNKVYVAPARTMFDGFDGSVSEDGPVTKPGNPSAASLTTVSSATPSHPTVIEGSKSCGVKSYQVQDDGDVLEFARKLDVRVNAKDPESSVAVDLSCSEKSEKVKLSLGELRDTSDRGNAKYLQCLAMMDSGATAAADIRASISSATNRIRCDDSVPSDKRAQIGAGGIISIRASWLNGLTNFDELTAVIFHEYYHAARPSADEAEVTRITECCSHGFEISNPSCRPQGGDTKKPISGLIADARIRGIVARLYPDGKYQKFLNDVSEKLISKDSRFKCLRNVPSTSSCSALITASSAAIDSARISACAEEDFINVRECPGHGLEVLDNDDAVSQAVGAQPVSKANPGKSDLADSTPVKEIPIDITKPQGARQAIALAATAQSQLLDRADNIANSLGQQILPQAQAREAARHVDNVQRNDGRSLASNAISASTSSAPLKTTEFATSGYKSDGTPILRSTTTGQQLPVFAAFGGGVTKSALAGTGGAETQSSTASSAAAGISSSTTARESSRAPARTQAASAVTSGTGASSNSRGSAGGSPILVSSGAGHTGNSTGEHAQREAPSGNQAALDRVRQMPLKSSSDVIKVLKSVPNARAVLSKDWFGDKLKAIYVRVDDGARNYGRTDHPRVILNLDNLGLK